MSVCRECTYILILNHCTHMARILPFRSLAVKLGISLPFSLVPTQDKAMDMETYPKLHSSLSAHFLLKIQNIFVDTAQ